ncbi:MAG: iron-containing alcohol dehydrogenase [Acidobacteriota bacterium]
MSRPGPDGIFPVPAGVSWEAHVGPTRVLAGCGALERLGSLARDLGGKRVLVVTDAGLRRAGHVERGVASLRAARVTPVVFDGVQENPTSTQVDAGTAFARDHDIDLIVGLGGGSSMDTAKGINFILTNGGTMADYRGRGKASQAMLGSIGVPTTAGTGSDAQSYALISDPVTRVKMACGDPKARFTAVILDPALSLTQPEHTTAVTALDAIGHAVETFVTRSRTPVSSLYARESWRLLSSHLPRVLATPADLDARAAMLWGAHLAGAAIEASMLGAAHACANPLTSRCRLEHGVAVALMLPHVVSFNRPAVGAEYGELMSIIGAVGDDLAERIVLLRGAAGLPGRLRDCGVTEADLQPMAGEAAAQWTGQHNPVELTVDAARKLYDAAY